MVGIRAWLFRVPLVVMGVMAWVSPLPAAASGIPTSYLIEDLGTFGGTRSAAFDINASGQAVGWATTPDDAYTHAFLYEGGVMRDLGTMPPGEHSYAAGINDLGHVVGHAYIERGQPFHAFLWDGAMMRDLGAFGGFNSYATAINNAGQIAVNAQDNYIPEVLPLVKTEFRSV